MEYCGTGTGIPAPRMRGGRATRLSSEKTVLSTGYGSALPETEPAVHSSGQPWFSVLEYCVRSTSVAVHGNGPSAPNRVARPLPVRLNNQPIPALVIAGRPSTSTSRHTLRRARARLVSLSALAAIVSSVACGATDAPSTTARAESPNAAGRSDGPTPPREVVIAAPSARYVVESVTAGGTLTGTITASAELQPGAPVSTGRDSAAWGPALPVERRLELEVDHCRLVPRVQGAVVGSAVNVLAHVPFRQHLHFLAGGEGGPRASLLLGQDEQVIPTNLPFDKPALVIVKDADHPWPTAYLAVFDHPYFAITAPNGSFTIDGVPSGHYTLKVWHERTKVVQQPVEVSPGATSTTAITLQAK